MNKTTHQSALDWIATQRDCMLQRVTAWANINTFSTNTAGLSRLTDILAAEFSPLGGDIQRHDLPPAESVDHRAQTIRTPIGQALSITKRPQAKLRILLNIHMDTVYPPGDPFQSVIEIENGKLRGPGVTDAKGGIAVMLTALEALEKFALPDRLGWQVLLNPDEEIGSPGSASLLATAAKDHHFGLLFEPALPDGALVDRRRGSGNFSDHHPRPIRPRRPRFRPGPQRHPRRRENWPCSFTPSTNPFPASQSTSAPSTAAHPPT